MGSDQDSAAFRRLTVMEGLSLNLEDNEGNDIGVWRLVWSKSRAFALLLTRWHLMNSAEEKGYHAQGTPRTRRSVA